MSPPITGCSGPRNKPFDVKVLNRRQDLTTENTPLSGGNVSGSGPVVGDRAWFTLDNNAVIEME